MTEIPQDRDTPPQGEQGREPKMVDVRESIRYRRRAQEAEGRCADLEAQLAELRLRQSERSETAEAALADQRRHSESLESELDRLRTERRLERELARAGAADVETALLVARERLAERDGDVDVEELARTVLDEKPHLKSARPEAVPQLGRPQRTATPPATARQTRTDRLAREARTSGKRGDLIEYMRARRTN